MVSDRRKQFDGYYLIPADQNDRWVMVLQGPWQNRYKNEILDRGVTSLRLSHAAGWREQDISFIRNLANTPIRGLEIYNWDVLDIAPLAELTELDSLGLECNYRKSIDFSAFKKLKTCSLRWRPKSDSIFGAQSLNTLNIVLYPYEDLTPLQTLSRLHELKLTSKKLKSMNGIDKLVQLSSLDLFQCPNLETLKGIEGASHLEKLELDTCKKISTLRPVRSLKELRRAAFNNCGKIDTLLPLMACTKLTELFFVEDTNVEDGSINIFEYLPALKTMWFANKKHYSHSREDVQQILDSRHK